eukprot:6550347-Alexandrium_andersonii.AAC.2
MTRSQPVQPTKRPSNLQASEPHHNADPGTRGTAPGRVLPAPASEKRGSDFCGFPGHGEGHLARWASSHHDLPGRTWGSVSGFGLRVPPPCGFLPQEESHPGQTSSHMA